MTNSIIKVLIPVVTAMMIFTTAETLGQEQQNAVNLETSQVELIAGPTNNVEVEGQVVNNSTMGVHDVVVTVQFYDPNGELLLENDKFISHPSQILQPGESMQFTILEPLGHNKVDKYVVIAEADAAS
ncbi:MAG TPA: FxLYD domain-containing protein [Nitrososphaeraceae archaeon]|jgi:hypothetical protein|nr:FxLYD domain-containing protein [Nitrososphaeraceae archaeon]